MNLDQRTAALLAVVDEAQRQRCAELLEPARAQQRATVAGALREARRRVRTALAEARTRGAQQVAAAQAQLATERRQHAQRHAAAQLTAGWRALREALQAQWNDGARRRAWVEAQLARALTLLPVDDTAAWQLAGPADWPGEEQQHAVAVLRARGIARVAATTDPAIRAGLRVQAGHNVLDATLDGLLADRAAVQGRLLQLIEESAHG